MAKPPLMAKTLRLPCKHHHARATVFPVARRCDVCKRCYVGRIVERDVRGVVYRAVEWTELDGHLGSDGKG